MHQTYRMTARITGKQREIIQAYIEASKNNPLQLYKRDQEGACKYGLCFTGVMHEELSDKFIVYNPA